MGLQNQLNLVPWWSGLLLYVYDLIDVLIISCKLSNWNQTFQLNTFYVFVSVLIVVILVLLFFLSFYMLTNLICRILEVSMDDLRQNFDVEASEPLKNPSNYARNFLEYCCFRSLSLSLQGVGHLSDKNFRRLTFDMMLAWEAPSSSSQPVLKVETTP